MGSCISFEHEQEKTMIWLIILHFCRFFLGNIVFYSLFWSSTKNTHQLINLRINHFCLFFKLLLVGCGCAFGIVPFKIFLVIHYCYYKILTYNATLSNIYILLLWNVIYCTVFLNTIFALLAPLLLNLIIGNVLLVYLIGHGNQT